MTEPHETTVRIIASDKNWIEGEAIRQLETTAILPGMVLAVGLPDLHPGRGPSRRGGFRVARVVLPAISRQRHWLRHGLMENRAETQQNPPRQMGGCAGRYGRRDRYRTKLLGQA